MRLPILTGTIRRRLLLNFRADPTVIEKLLPSPFRPKIYKGYSILGVCLIRLEEIRPRGFPPFIGVASENAAHRIAVEWMDPKGTKKDGVFIPRRDTNSLLNRLAGGNLFPGLHRPARFDVVDDGHHIDFRMDSRDGSVSIRVTGEETVLWSENSCFPSLEAASPFFECGSQGYSFTGHQDRFDGMELHTLEWRVAPFAVSSLSSRFFEDPQRFPKGSVEFDHALIMRNILHEWHALRTVTRAEATSAWAPQPQISRL